MASGCICVNGVSIRSWEKVGRDIGGVNETPLNHALHHQPLDLVRLQVNHSPSAVGKLQLFFPLVRLSVEEPRSDGPDIGGQSTNHRLSGLNLNLELKAKSRIVKRLLDPLVSHLLPEPNRGGKFRVFEAPLMYG